MKNPVHIVLYKRGNFDFQIIKDIVLRTPYRFMAIGISRSEIKSGNSRNKCTGDTPDSFFGKKIANLKKSYHWLQYVYRKLIWENREIFAFLGN